MTPPPAGRPARPQITLTVLRREQLSAHLVRLVLGGDQFGDVVPNGLTDAYVKIFFAKPSLGLQPPYDLVALRETLAPDDLPVTRTYTVRSLDALAETLSIDFVVHGDDGLAGPFANRAQPGDAVTFAGPSGGYAPDPSADWHLFAGDLSALPAIAAALAQLAETAPSARGLAFIAVADASDELVLDAPAGVEVRWLYGAAAGAAGSAAAGADGAHDADGSAALAAAVAAAEWLPGRPQIFAHGERSAMKELRDLFRARGVQRSELSLSGYWAEGRTEDRFQAEKREPIGVIAPVSD